MQNQVQEIKSYLLQLQDNICDSLLSFENEKRFTIDSWERPLGGTGETRALQLGQCFESAGVNFSHVFGDNLPAAATQRRPELANSAFEALGVSVIIHPRNPFVPTSHFNVRFFSARNENEEPVWWFGGGFDLTPFYPFKEDCIHWHQTAKVACQPFGKDIYPKYKKWADDYFHLKHRNEARGIGGLFFDDLNDWDFEKCFQFMQSIGDQFSKAYIPIVEKRQHTPYTNEQQAFQRYRRGRYVEYNLLYDRGTLFGLQSGGRTESILLSLPPHVNFRYDWQAEPGSLEAKLLEEFLVVQDWV